MSFRPLWGLLLAAGLGAGATHGSAGAQTVAVPAGAQSAGSPPSATSLRRGRDLLASGQFSAARKWFLDALRQRPTDVAARMGLGEAEMGLHQYEAAESTLRAVTSQQPELWQAHKLLVQVEAALGRWEEFDRERAVLRMARQRGALSARESDVIDSFVAGGDRWVVRAYFDPVGRSGALMNFEHFSPEGRVLAYISLEDAQAAAEALTPGDVRIGEKSGQATNNSAGRPLALNWYTAKAHGTVRRYSDNPPYPALRAEVKAWIAAHPADVGIPAGR